MMQPRSSNVATRIRCPAGNIDARNAGDPSDGAVTSSAHTPGPQGDPMFAVIRHYYFDKKASKDKAGADESVALAAEFVRTNMAQLLRQNGKSSKG